MRFFSSFFSRFTQGKNIRKTRFLTQTALRVQKRKALFWKSLSGAGTNGVRLSFNGQINSNFLYGNQRCDINFKSGTVEQYGEVNDGLECEVFNQIEPLYKTRQAI